MFSPIVLWLDVALHIIRWLVLFYCNKSVVQQMWILLRGVETRAFEYGDAIKKQKKQGANEWPEPPQSGGNVSFQ